MDRDYLKWYPWNPYTFWSDSRIDELSLEEMAVYRSLLDHMWMHPACKLPDIDKHNTRRTRTPTAKEYRRIKESLLDAGLLIIEGDMLISPDLLKIKERSDKAYKFGPKKDKTGA